MDSTAAIETVRPDGIGLGQRFAVASIEVGTRLRARNNEATARWVPAHRGVLGNEEAVADGGEPNDVVPHDYRWETSLPHMTRVATPVDCRQHWGPPAGVPPPFGEGPRAQATPTDAKVGGKTILSAAVGPCRHRPMPRGQGPQDGGRQVLAVWGRKKQTCSRSAGPGARIS